MSRVLRAGASAPEPWIRFAARPAGPPRLRLLCFHHAGGGATLFREWPGVLAPRGIEVWPVQLPGRETRIGEPKPTDLAELTSELADVLAGPLKGVPYAVYGHSVGAYVGSAFALRMSERGLPGPRYVVTGAARPPGHPDPDAPIHLMGDKELLAKLETYGGIPPLLRSSPELMDMAVDIARADLRLVETASWPDRPWFTCPLTAVGGERDATVPVALLPLWDATTSGRTGVLTLPGGHFPDSRAARRLMEVISHETDRSEGGVGGI
ncbi:alpha/beta fold hydrolase [Streptomyces phaeofaciens JCM 4814]|uniref:Thioesterase n=1 Tax=Streptomyces phaeofaciens TaxID=68254 RepID=A0A918LZP9_9ACTN|nr:alpha/beta fold hydrolase [Streptomyces phaeofaciens]GGT80725.1 thioesterase [Streptomyces phaeofaciens]